MHTTHSLKNGPGVRDTVENKAFDIEFVKKDMTALGVLSVFYEFKDHMNVRPASACQH